MDAEEFFFETYSDRWKLLRHAMVAEPLRKHRAVGLDQIQFSEQDSIRTYKMDPASALPVLLLLESAFNEEPQVLDMCAAPGGKAMILADLAGPKARFVFNEFSRDRFFQLQNVLKQYLKADVLERVQCTNYDGNQFGIKRPKEFDSILLDAPCSSERHLLEQNKLNEWSLRRTKSNAMKQYSLLCSALLSLKKNPYSRIVYSTCSISPYENDKVIEKLLKKKSCTLDLPTDLQWQNALPNEISSQIEIERTAFGFIVLPDRSHGFGPMYLTRLKLTV